MTIVCLGKIIAVHGTKGHVEIETRMEHPSDIGSFGVIKDANGHKYKLLSARVHSHNTVIARIQGVTDNIQAQALCGTELFTERALLVLQARRLH